MTRPSPDTKPRPPHRLRARPLDQHPPVVDPPPLAALGSRRALAPGVTGSDVKQFEQNLAALGYKGFTVDEKFNAATAIAVKAWQDDLGLTETGTVGPYAVAYAPGAVRVAEQKVSAGAPAGGRCLPTPAPPARSRSTWTCPKRGLVETGASVTVKLPDKSTVAGAVASVGRVAETKTASDGKSTTTVEVIVSIPDQGKLGSLDESPVAVTFVASQHKDVLTVPILALLALAEGGYGVQVVEGSTTRIVAVETGMFAGGRVEISGAGITTDTVVGVPK